MPMGGVGPKGDKGDTGASAPTVEVLEMRVGSVTLEVLDGVTKAVTFTSPTPDTNYQVTFGPPTSMAVAPWATNKTVNGFIINVAVAVAATISYIAAANN